MKRRSLWTLLFSLIMLIPLSGCLPLQLTSDEHLECINQTGQENGLAFQAAAEWPDMPNGAVIVRDIDQRKYQITEIFLPAEQMQALDPSDLLFISPQNKVAVIFHNNSIGVEYGFYEDEVISSLYDYTFYPKRRNVILYVKNMTSWGLQDYEELKEKFSSDNYYHLDYDMLEYLYTETHQPNSPYYTISPKTSMDEIREIIFNALLETQSINPTTEGGTVLNDVALGNRYNYADLPPDVWKIYDLPLRCEGTWLSGLKKTVTNDLRFLLEST